MASSPHPARRLWHAIETLHAVAYFAPGCTLAAKAIGLDSFWLGYFGFRAAPLGPVGPAVVEATFANFAPAFVRRWVPRCWTLASVASCLEARATSAAAALREAGVDVEALEAAAAALAPVLDGLDVTGRPLAAANLTVPSSSDPVQRFWQVATTLREHRGDGHVAALVAEGVTGLQAHVLQAPVTRIDEGYLRSARGWDEEAWDRAAADLVARSVDRDAVLAAVEARTDTLAWDGGLSVLGADGVDGIVKSLGPSIAAVYGTGWLTFPNPMGLPNSAG